MCEKQVLKLFSTTNQPDILNRNRKMFPPGTSQLDGAAGIFLWQTKKHVWIKRTFSQEFQVILHCVGNY